MSFHVLTCSICGATNGLTKLANSDKIYCKVCVDLFLDWLLTNQIARQSNQYLNHQFDCDGFIRSEHGDNSWSYHDKHAARWDTL